MKLSLYQPECVFELGRRENQEDALFPQAGAATAASRIFVVCDGMGGHECGEVASSVVCQTIAQQMLIRWKADRPIADEDFTQALATAYDALDRADTGGRKKMGTTLAVLCFHRGGCLAAHIGDSRIYHFRPQTGEILYRSRDHSLVNQLYETGEITRQEMLTSKKRNILLRALQPHQPQRTVADLIHITDIEPDDYFLVCSDGILEHLDDADFMELLSSPGQSLAQAAAQLKQLTEANSDNHTCYLVRVKNVEREGDDFRLPNDEPAARAASRALNDTTPFVEVTVQDVEDDDDEEALANQTMFLENADAMREVLDGRDAPAPQQPWHWSRIVVILLSACVLLLIVLKLLKCL